RHRGVPHRELDRRRHPRAHRPPRERRAAPGEGDRDLRALRGDQDLRRSDPMSARRPAPRGETLIEAMVAMAVFAIGLLGVLAMSLVADGQNSLAARETKAANLARDLADDF